MKLTSNWEIIRAFQVLYGYALLVEIIFIAFRTKLEWDISNVFDISDASKRFISSLLDCESAGFESALSQVECPAELQYQHYNTKKIQIFEIEDKEEIHHVTRFCCQISLGIGPGFIIFKWHCEKNTLKGTFSKNISLFL